MAEAFDLNQDNLLLQLKNMPKPPISKELAKEIGFDQKKYETIIEKLLVQISEVRKERIKENYIFEQKIKSMQIPGQNNKNNKIVIKNNIKKNSKNLKININRPKSNYKSVRSSGYGMAPKKIDIFSTRAKKNINSNNKNNVLNINNNNNNNKNMKLIPKSKTNNANKKINTNINNNSKDHTNIHEQKKIDKNFLKNDNNKNNNINKNKNQIVNLREIKSEIDKINNENKLLEQEYNKISNQIINNVYAQKNNKNKILCKNNGKIIKNEIEPITNNIINDLLYELIDDLKNIEDAKKEKDKKNIINNKKTKKNKIIIKKFKANPNKNLIERCDLNRKKFYEHMKLKGSFLTNDIFKIYDEFVEEVSKEILEQSLNYCIEQMDNFINNMYNQK